MDPKLFDAKQAFQQARQRARIQELAAQLTGKEINLLVYEEVRQRLNAIEGATRELQNIPINAIIGSVGRYNDFNREFLPLRNEDRDRWARVKMVMDDIQGLPPIDVYRVGEAYFVSDGNHRVSIAREFGATEIEAYVRTVQSRVPLPADANYEDLIILSEYTDFLQHTRLDELRPEADLRLTEAGQYHFLLQQIEVQNFLLELHLGTEISYEQAVSEWYDEVYLPVVQLIRSKNFLKNFPHRTEGDFFVWLLDHQARLTKETGWLVRMDAALKDFSEKIYHQAESLTGRIRSVILDALHIMRDPHPVGEWRTDHKHRPGRMFGEILVAFQGAPPWPALTCALEIAQHEHAQLYGLYISPRKTPPKRQAEIQQQFDALCQESDVEGLLVFEKGKTNTLLPSRSRWVDLVIVPLELGSSARLGKNLPAIRPLIQHCRTPVLVFPDSFTFPSRVLLAYDGSKKAEEALFLATYFSSFWELDLVIFSVIPFEKNHPFPAKLAYAEEYLRSYHIKATYCHGHGEVSEEILRAAQNHACDLILMGGYGEIPLFGGFRKRTVDAVLAGSNIPVLVCR